MTASKRNWGKGMACVARTKKCNIVPLNHFGPIPGVEVGTTWLYRIQVSCERINHFLNILKFYENANYRFLKLAFIVLI